jgi:subtilisin family serine protease
MKNDVPSIASVLNDALSTGVLVFASASNVGANDRITFPARLHGIFCIGSADTYGNRSRFSPPFEGEEKYSILGEAVAAACPMTLSKEQGYDRSNRTIQRDGTSTATPIAAGIAALLIDFTRQFMDKGKTADTYENMRRLFIGISEATVGKDYRYLALPYVFGPGKDSKAYIKEIISVPAGT